MLKFIVTIYLCGTVISANLRCETIGRCPINHSKCKSFLVCSAKNGMLTGDVKTCAISNKYFDPKLQICSDKYKCPDVYCENPSTPGTKFVNPNDKTKESYLMCEADSTSTYIPVVKYCPLGQEFNTAHPAILIGACVNKCNI